MGSPNANMVRKHARPERCDSLQPVIENLLGLISDCEENEWPRTFLKMQINRAYCMLALRFWQLD